MLLDVNATSAVACDMKLTLFVLLAAVDMAAGLCWHSQGLASHGRLECEHLQAH